MGALDITLSLLCNVLLIGALVSSESVELEESKASSQTSLKKYKTEYGCICILIYAPVCASDGKTYGNSCELECVRKQNPYLLGVCHGTCPCCKEQYHNKPITIEIPGVGEAEVDEGSGSGWGPDRYANKTLNVPNAPYPSISSDQKQPKSY